MVFGFGILVLAALFIAAGISGRSLGEVVRGEVGRGFALADIKVPTIMAAAPVAGGDAKTASLVSTGGTDGTGLLECFYDPLGYYFDSGRIIRGSIGGHSDHVHVGAEPGLLARLAKIGQGQFRLTIREYAPYDKVDPVHVPGSLHYSGRAFDASGTTADMAAFARYVMQGKK